MFSNNLCPSCYRLAGKLASKNPSNLSRGYSVDQPNDIFSESQQPDFSKCSGCAQIIPQVKREAQNCADGLSDDERSKFSNDISDKKCSSDLIGLTSLSKVNDKRSKARPKMESKTTADSEWKGSVKQTSETINYQENDLQDLNSIKSTRASVCNYEDIFNEDSIFRHDLASRSRIDLDLQISDTVDSKGNELQPIDNYRIPSYYYFKPVELLQGSVQDDELTLNYEHSISDHPGTEGFNEEIVETDEQSSRLADSNHSKIKKKVVYDDWVHPIYSNDTKQLMNPKEIKAKILSHYIIDESQERPYICQIDHECQTFFINDQNVKNHIFKHFYYTLCSDCGKSFKSIFLLNKHMKKCTEREKKKNEESVPLSQETVEDSVLDIEVPKKTINSHNEREDVTIDKSIEENPIIESCGAIESKIDHITETIPIQIHSIDDDDQLKSTSNDLEHPLTSTDVDKFDIWSLPIYFSDTNEKVDPDEVKSKLVENYSIDKSKKRSYICKIDHACSKSFTRSLNVKNHIFSHLFYSQCPICNKRFTRFFSIDRHIKSCKEKPLLAIQSTEPSLKSDNDDVTESESKKIEPESKPPRPLIFDNWTFPTYCCDTNELVTPSKIKEKIKSSYTKDANKKRSFICQIDHDCQKVFSRVGHIENHLFNNFFFVLCPSCRKIFNYLFDLTNHLKLCKKPDAVSSISKRPISDVIESHEETENKKMKVLSTSTENQRQVVKPDEWIHPIYNSSTCETVDHDEIINKIASNYIIEQGEKLLYVCQAEHECNRSWLRKYEVEKHLFSHFFFVPCPKCQKKFSLYDSMNLHLPKCKRNNGKTES